MSATETAIILLGASNLTLVGAVVSGRLARPERRQVIVRICRDMLVGSKPAPAMPAAHVPPSTSRPAVHRPAAAANGRSDRLWANGQFSDKT